MRWVTGALACVLSLLIVSTSASASICDLSCWLHQVDSDCHATAFSPAGQAMTSPMPSGMHMDAPADATPMTMDSDNTSGMDMAAEGNEGLPALRFEPHPAHLMSTHIDLAIGHLKSTARSGQNSKSERHHSASLSCCANGNCARSTVSAPPPDSGQSQPSCLHFVAISISGPAYFWTTSQKISSATLPREDFPVRIQTTTLRV